MCCAAAPVAALDGRPSVTWERTVDGATSGADATVYGLVHVFGNKVAATLEAQYSQCSDQRWHDELFPPAGVYCRHHAWAWVGAGETCPTPPNDLQWAQGRVHTYGGPVTPRAARLGRAEEGNGHALPAGKRSCWTARESVGSVASAWASPVWWDVDASGRVVATSGKGSEPVSTRYDLPLVPPASNGAVQGFVRVINHSNESGTVSIEAIDDAGVRYGPVTLAIAAKHTVNFNSRDLEEGNAAKRLSGGVGDGEGHWRLELTTTLDIEPNAYIRTADGFLTSVHDSVVEGGPGRYHVPFFNPGSNRSQVSQLRIVNTGDTRATVEIDGLDDRGQPPASTVKLALAPRRAVTVSARDLEAGASWLDGRFGDGAGKWHLYVSADRPIEVMSLLRSPTGHLTNLSTTTTVADRVPPLHACTDPAAEVSIPDAGLRGVVEEALDKTAGETITQGELAGLTSLDAYGREIRSLAGLECATGLTDLDLEDNWLTDVSPLAGLTALTSLSLHGNQVTDISPLAGLTGLTKLWLLRNQLTDISPLAGLTKLTWLVIEFNQLTDVSSLAGLTELTDLSLGGNQLIDVSSLAGLTTLTELGLSYNQITDLSPLAALTGLTFVGLDRNQLTDLSPLVGLKALEELHLSGNQITDLSPLAALTGLTFVGLGSNQLTDLSPLAGLIGLEYLYLSTNQISDIGPLVSNAGLNDGDYLYLAENPLSTRSRDTHIPALRARGVNVEF